VRRYETWEAYWETVLFNRAFYFFHKHSKNGGHLVPAVAEWPLARYPRMGCGSSPPEIPALSE